MRTMNEYEKQAQDFLQRHNLDFKRYRAVPNECPPFCCGKHIHGDKWHIVIARGIGRQDGATLEFPFWNSKNDQVKRKAPSAYDVFACISGDVHCPDTFKDFCADYGYDEDSRKAEATFKGCREFADNLQAFFSQDEIDDLIEIR